MTYDLDIANDLAERLCEYSGSVRYTLQFAKPEDLPGFRLRDVFMLQQVLATLPQMPNDQFTALAFGHFPGRMNTFEGIRALSNVVDAVYPQGPVHDRMVRSMQSYADIYASEWEGKFGLSPIECGDYMQNDFPAERPLPEISQPKPAGPTNTDRSPS